MKLILLSGGSGENLWPLSNQIRSKQFIQLFYHNDVKESLVQRIYRQIHTIHDDLDIVVATSNSQVSTIQHQLSTSIPLSIEPARKDTFPAIVLACEYLKYHQEVKEDETIIVCPMDLYVEDQFFEKVLSLDEYVQQGEHPLYLIGVNAYEASTRYGYICLNDQKECVDFHSRVGQNMAEQLVSEGALWNSGVYAFKLDYLLNQAKDLIPYGDYVDLFNQYPLVKPISFDDAIVSKEDSIGYIPYDGKWIDIGTWQSMSEVMAEDVIGEGLLGEACKNVHIINELNVPIIGLGLEDTVIAASSQGILVTSNQASESVKPYVNQVDSKVMFSEKSWGAFHIIDVDDDSTTIKVMLREGNRMNYHSHELRDEVWTIVSGEGKTIVDGMEQIVHPGDVITMQAGCKHTIIALTDLYLIEVQLGEDTNVLDKTIYEFPYEKDE